jgi:predicted nuclease of predicted toxin-antitoxin system
MKLLFDQNLSPRLPERLQENFPGSRHVHEMGMGSALDAVVWAFARENGFTIVTKDADYSDLSTTEGFPPKVVWIQRGNCSTEDIESLLRQEAATIEEFEKNSELGIIVIA